MDERATGTRYVHFKVAFTLATFTCLSRTLQYLCHVHQQIGLTEQRLLDKWEKRR
jgi:hypothetical protein